MLLKCIKFFERCYTNGYNRRYIYMDKNQTINCTVGSCKFNNQQNQQCQLQQIIVEPVEGCNTGKSNESLCSSYKNN